MGGIAAWAPWVSPSPQFEKVFVLPPLSRYGLLESSGIELAGLLPASKLLDLYRESALGVVNPNWSGSTETFCCSGAEDAGRRNPGDRRRTGRIARNPGGPLGRGCTVSRPDLTGLADAIVELLQRPEPPEEPRSRPASRSSVRTTASSGSSIIGNGSCVPLMT